MKKFSLFVMAAALGLFAMNTIAAPDGVESFNIKATFDIQEYNPTSNVYKIWHASFGNKDALFLVGNEFERTFPSGSMLALYGLGIGKTDQVAVVSSTGSVLLGNASFNNSLSDSYRFSFRPSPRSFTAVHSEDSPKWNFVSDCGEFCYRSGTGGYFINLRGLVNYSDNYKGGYIENYNMPSSAGQFNLYLGSDFGYSYGNIVGSINGSGKDIEFPWLNFATLPPP